MKEKGNVPGSASQTDLSEPFRDRETRERDVRVCVLYVYLYLYK